jgi:hypothetical protein
MSESSHEHISQNKSRANANQHQGKGVSQLAPCGTYANATPNAKGTYTDKADVVAHNNINVPSRSISVMKEADDGGVPSVDPPGWNWLKGNFGSLKGQWVRFHIINGKLGGPGNSTANLVPTTVATNLHGNWRTMEDEAKTHCNVTKDWTYLDVSLVYDNAFPAGIPKSVAGEWGKWTGNAWASQKSSGTISQANPALQGNGGYVPGSSLTKDIIKNTYKVHADLVNSIFALLNGTYADQDTFEEAWVSMFENADEKTLANIQARIYVDEDDQVAGPYGVVVKTK